MIYEHKQIRDCIPNYSTANSSLFVASGNFMKCGKNRGDDPQLFEVEGLWRAMLYFAIKFKWMLATPLFILCNACGSYQQADTKCMTFYPRKNGSN